MRLDPSTLVLAGLAIVFAVIAYVKDPSLPAIGARNGLAMLGFVLPRLVPALLLAGLFQVVVPQEVVSRYFGREAGFRGLVMAMGAGVITPGGPMVSVPFLVALAHSGAGLPEFVAHLERRGRLRRVNAPVSRDLEITEIVDRVSKSNGDANVALLFERVEGFDIPVLVNAFGSADRMATALGVERLDELGARIAKLLDLKMPGSFLDKMRKLGTLLDVAKASPRHVRAAPCQEIVETASPSLAALPILTCWPRDGGRYITLPAVFTRDPVTGESNVGMSRLQVFDDRTL